MSVSVRSIMFKFVVKGKGIVNYGSKEDGRTLWDVMPEWRGVLRHKNFKIAKHIINKIGVDEKGDATYDIKLKVSSACIRNAIFSGDQPFHNPDLIHAPKALIKLIGSVVGVLRGYMFEVKGGGIKRKSPITITDAIQIGNEKPTMDIGTQTCPKNPDSEGKKDLEENSGLSMHYKESVGNVEYLAQGAIDLCELQFISLSQKYDRLAVNPDYFEEYKATLEKVVGGEIKKGFFVRGINGLPEEGILLNDEQCKKLIKEFFKKLLGFRIVRGGGGMAEMSQLKLKLLKNPIEDRFSSEEGWYKVSSIDDLKLSENEVHQFYTDLSQEESEALYSEMDKGKKEISDAKKIEKENKAKVKAAKNKTQE